MKNNFLDKLKSNFFSTLPIIILVSILGLTITPLSLYDFGMFFIGCILLLVGISFFTIGADYSMFTIGSSIGSHLSKSRKILVITLFSVALGFIITLAEPDLTVLANQVLAVNQWLFIGVVSAGVGILLGLAVLKIIFQVKLKTVLFIAYGIVLVLMFFSPTSFLPIALDAGAVTTGAISVPFILAFGMGISAVRGGQSDDSESFGLIALISVGPLITTLLLSLFISNPNSLPTSTLVTTPQSGSFASILSAFGSHLGHTLIEILLVLLPIVIFFFIFNFLYLKYPKRKIIKICVGLVYTYIGISLFLTAVLTGFLPIASILGYSIYNSSYSFLLLPIAALIGFIVVLAEPAVLVLNKKIEEVTQGVITKKVMTIAICVGVALSMVLSVLRVLYNINLLYIMVPIYLLTLFLTIFSPKIFTALAFDSGGVASGTMATSFIMPFLMGLCEAKGVSVALGGFGTIATIAIAPVFVVTLLGVTFRVLSHIKQSKQKPKTTRPVEIVEFDWED